MKVMGTLAKRFGDEICVDFDERSSYCEKIKMNVVERWGREIEDWFELSLWLICAHFKTS